MLEYCTLTSPVQPSELTFQWSKQTQNGERINIEDGMKYNISHDGFLTITNVQPSDSGVYLVNISNSQGFAIHAVQLRVVGKYLVLYIILTLVSKITVALSLAMTILSLWDS